MEIVGKRMWGIQQEDVALMKDLVCNFVRNWQLGAGHLCRDAFYRESIPSVGQA